MPGLHAFLLILIALVAFYLYTRPWIRMALVSVLLLLALVVLFYFVPYVGVEARLTDVEVLEAFGHPALIAICCLMILARGLTMTGAIEPAVRMLSKLWRVSHMLGLLITLIVAGGASAFINDTPVLVLMLPMLLGLSARTGQPVSKVLMPVNFAILAGGMLTSIGTSTNLLVVKIAEDLGMRPIGVFEFTSTALVAFAIALPYLWLVAPRLLPDTKLVEVTSLRKYEGRIEVKDGSAQLVGRTLEGVGRALGRPLPAFALMRQGREQAVDAAAELAIGDAVGLRDTPDGLREIASVLHVDLFDRQGAGRFIEHDASHTDMGLAELVVGSESPLTGRTLKETRFAAQHQVVVVGLHRASAEALHERGDTAETPLAAGDVLLVQGPLDKIERLRGVPDLLLLDSSLVFPRSRLAPAALAIMGGVVLLAATKLLPIHIAAFVGVMGMLSTGCVRLEGVGRALSLDVVLLMAASLALGQGMVSTGAASWIAQGVAIVVVHMPPAAQLAVFMSFAALLTNFVSNAAAAAVGTPIAVATAVTLGLPLEPFVLAILFGANLSYATPMAYQTNLLVMNAAGYRFSDFVRVGLPLVALMLVVLSMLLATRYGL